MQLCSFGGHHITVLTADGTKPIMFKGFQQSHGFLFLEIIRRGQSVGMASLFVVFVALLIEVWFELKNFEPNRD